MVAINDFASLAGGSKVNDDRVTLNNNFAALAACFYSDDGTEPPETWRGMLWLDAQAGYVKQRNENDDDWYVVGKLFASGSPSHLGVLKTVLTKDTEGTTATDAIRFSIQVMDAAGTDSVSGRRVILVAISTSSFGAPGGTQTVTVSTGSELADLGGSADQLLLVETDASGLAEVDIVVSGADDRYVRAWVGDSEPVELQGTWAA